ncbi:MAG: efflux RND transporter periplasmic adaptor subunit [Thermodesulfobacteriota bacterium]
MIGSLGAFIILILFLIFYKVPLKVISPCSIEPFDYTVVRTEGSGFLKKILHDQGEKVKKGEVLGILDNPELMMQYEKLRLLYSGLMVKRRKAFGLSEYVNYDQIEYELNKVEKEIEKLGEKIEKLKILSPKDGMILTPKLTEMKGDFFPEGRVFCEIGYLDGVQIRVIIPEEDFSEVVEGLPVELKVYAYAEKVFSGKVMEISLAKVESLENPALSSKYGGSLPTERLTKTGETPKLPFFQITMKIDNPDGLLKPGMTGLSKIYCKKRSVISLLWNRVLRMIKPERILIFS